MSWAYYLSKLMVTSNQNNFSFKWRHVVFIYVQFLLGKLFNWGVYGNFNDFFFSFVKNKKYKTFRNKRSVQFSSGLIPTVGFNQGSYNILVISYIIFGFNSWRSRDTRYRQLISDFKPGFYNCNKYNQFSELF